MIFRLQVRKVPRRKRSGKMTGAIYLHNHIMSGKQVVVMNIANYRFLRKQIVVAHRKLDKIKIFAGTLKLKPVNI